MSLLALLLAIFAGAPAVDGAVTRVIIVADAPSKLVDDAAAALKSDGDVVDVRALGDSDPAAEGGPFAHVEGAVVLAAGPKSARALAAFHSRTHAPQLADHALADHAAAFLVKAVDVPAGLAAVTLDTPVTTQLSWVRAAFPGRTRVIVPRNSHADDDSLRAAALASGLSLVLVDVKSAGETVPAVDEALKRSGGPALVLLVPDPVAVTPDTVAPLVQDALALHVPVVGFSAYFLKVGAMAAVAVDAASMARQARALALSSSASSGGQVGPTSAHLVVDGRLAERLGVSVREGPGVEVRR